MQTQKTHKISFVLWPAVVAAVINIASNAIIRRGNSAEVGVFAALISALLFDVMFYLIYRYGISRREDNTAKAWAVFMVGSLLLAGGQIFG